MKSGKPVAAPSRLSYPAPTMWSLAFGLGATREQASLVVGLFSRAPADWGNAEVLLAWWQQRMSLVEPEAVTAPWATAIHHELLDVLTTYGSLAGDVRLPCKTCGRLFTSRPPRYARSCTACHRSKSAKVRARYHGSGTAPVGAGSWYAQGTKAASLWWPALCAHPECVSLFGAAHRERRYCDKHQRDRSAAQRARRKVTAPKDERFVFRALLEQNGQPIDGVRVQFCVDEDGRERVCEVTTAGYQARDALEFVALANMAASDGIPFTIKPL